MAAAVDSFSTFEVTLESPFNSAATVTPSDSTDLAYVTRGLFVGTGGAVAVTVGGQNVTFGNVPSGTMLTIRASRVLSTGTTASNIVAVW